MLMRGKLKFFHAEKYKNNKKNGIFYVINGTIWNKPSGNIDKIHLYKCSESP